jgi:hypothetical protein
VVKLFLESLSCMSRADGLLAASVMQGLRGSLMTMLCLLIRLLLLLLLLQCRPDL